MDAIATTTLTEFLLARIAEDEAVAQAARPAEHLRWRDDRALTATEVAGYGAVATTSGRVLAECEAKRRIVERLRGDAPSGPDGEIGWDYLDPTLLGLVSVYADHPEYRDEWRPSET